MKTQIFLTQNIHSQNARVVGDDAVGDKINDLDWVVFEVFWELFSINQYDNLI